LFSTYIGGYQWEYAKGMVVNSNGDIYITGDTHSPDFPMVNAYDSTKEGTYAIFVLKLASSGDEILYSTYVCGSSDAYAEDIHVDSFGEVYVTGYTRSADFPTVNAYDDSFNGGPIYGDSYVFKLNSTGNGLQFSTFVGGTEDDVGTSVATDADSNIYVAGWTYSDDFPVENAYLATPDNVFVYKLNSSGTGLLFSTFFEGPGLDPLSIAVDTTGDVYITGKTSSSLVTVNAYDDEYNGLDDCFVSKLSASGDTMLYSTFIGGTNQEIGLGIDLDSSGNVYVTGTTLSTDFPVSRPFQNESGGSYDCFVAVLNSTGNGLAYSTFIGGDSRDEGRSIAVDSDGVVAVAGITWSNDFPILGAYQPTLNSESDVFTLKLDADIDSDGDGLSNDYETLIGTSPEDADSDNDLMPDGWEVENGLLPLVNDSANDADTDDLANLLEYQYGTDPQDEDSDDDQLSDGAEVHTHGTDPLSTDSDSDGLDDYEEVVTYGTNPLNSDSDGDGDSDYDEIQAGNDPLSEGSQLDTDGDGLSNTLEYEIGTNPRSADSDGDGIPDGWEYDHGLNPLEWTYATGQAMEALTSSLILSGLMFATTLIAICILAKLRINKGPLPALRKRVLVGPGVVFLISLLLLSPFAMYGSENPGINRVQTTSSDFSFITYDTPWYTNKTTIRASYEAEYADAHVHVTLTVRTAGAEVGSYLLTLGGGWVGQIRSDSEILYLASGSYSVSWSYEYKDTFGDDLGSTTVTIEMTQEDADGSNEDQRIWPIMKGGLTALGVIMVVIGFFFKTEALDNRFFG
jgi:hypothetical protein